jgi:hypothetical protein
MRCYVREARARQRRPEGSDFALIFLWYFLSIKGKKVQEQNGKVFAKWKMFKMENSASQNY